MSQLSKAMPMDGRGEGPVLARLAASMEAAERAGAVIAGICIFAVMVVVFADVLFRYFLNSPLTFSYDLVGLYLLPAIFFLSVSDTFRRNHHVAVDIVYLRVDRRMQRLSRVITAVIALVVFGPVVWLSARLTTQQYVGGDVIGGSILWPTWIPSALVFLGFALLTLRLALDTCALVAALAKGTERVVGESPERETAQSVVEEI